MALGGGIEADLPHGIHWRLIQMDYLLTQFGGGSQKTFGSPLGFSSNFERKRLTSIFTLAS
jgi:hypothetical protein